MKRMKDVTATRTNLARFCAVFLAAAILFVFAGAPAAAAAKRGKIGSPPREAEILPAPLPNRGTIAVLTKAWSPQYAASTTAIFTRQLLARGYKVVDPKTLEKIRNSKAAMAALNGDVDAIIRIGSQYGVSATITANAEAGSPVLNEFSMYTGTASLAVMAVSSGGSVLYADTVSGKQVGYTPDESMQKSVEAAATLAVRRLTE